MGFVPGATIEIEAFLTQEGATQLMTSGIGVIKYFAVSDEASNYATDQKLTFNQVFTLSGKLTIQNKSLSVLSNTELYSRIFVDRGFETYKTFESDSGMITSEIILGEQQILGPSGVYATPFASTLYGSGYVLNWVKDLNLRYGTTDNTIWSLDFNSGGFNNTSLKFMSGYYNYFSVDGSLYSYMDGKSIKFSVDGRDYYGAHLNTNQPLSYYDSLYSDDSNYLARFGPNTILLFSDSLQRPNNDATKSWSTGYGSNAPYSQGGKNLANFIASPGKNLDYAAGIAFLDKGVIVIFYESFAFGGDISTIVLNNRNVVKRTVANFVCDLPLGKFYRSQNSTFYPNAPVRISTIGLFSENKELLAVGRLNSEIEKSSGQRFTFLVKLVI